MVCVLPKASVEEEVPVSVDEKQVAPVHPAPGGLVYILRGAYQFATGRIVEVRPASQMAVVQLQSQGSTKERGSITVPLADVCKYEEATQ
jgi:transcription antitermination factor NusG